jgi:hypothetical protein
MTDSRAGRGAAARSRAGVARVVAVARRQPEPVKQFVGAAIVASAVVAVIRKPGAAWVGAASDVGTRASTVQFPPPNPISNAWGAIHRTVVRLSEDAETVELLTLFAAGIALRMRDRLQRARDAGEAGN